MARNQVYWMSVSSTNVVPTDGYGGNGAVTVTTGISSGSSHIILHGFQPASDMAAARTISFGSLRLASAGGAQEAGDVLLTLPIPFATAATLLGNEYPGGGIGPIPFGPIQNLDGTEVAVNGFYAVVSSIEAAGLLFFSLSHDPFAA